MTLQPLNAFDMKNVNDIQKLQKHHNTMSSIYSKIDHIEIDKRLEDKVCLLK